MDIGKLVGDKVFTAILSKVHFSGDESLDNKASGIVDLYVWESIPSEVYREINEIRDKVIL